MWIDFIVAAVLLIFIFRGDRRGLLSSLLGVIGWAASFIAAFLFYPEGVRFLDKYTGLREGIQSRVVQYVKEEAITKITGSSDMDSMPSSIKAVLSSSSNSELDLHAAKIAAPIVSTIMDVIAIILIMILVGLIFKIISSAVRGLTKKNRVIGTADSIGGILFGLIEGAILSYILLIFLFYAATFLSISPLASQLNDSMVMGLITKYDMIPYGNAINGLIG